MANDRYPIDCGENFTKEYIDSMFSLAWKKGTVLILDEDGAWYIEEDGDGGWNADWDFAKENIERLT